MSKLSLNIPITIEPTAILSIGKDNITQRVLDVNNNYSEYKSLADKMSMYVYDSNNPTYASYNGITLTNDKCIIDADKIIINGTYFFTNTDGQATINTKFLTVGELQSTDHILSTSDNGVNVKIENGMIISYSTTKNSYIKIGVDENSYMTLLYYNESYNDKEIIYELSPYTPFSSNLNS